MTTCTTTLDPLWSTSAIRASMADIARHELAEIDPQMSMIRISSARGHLTGEMIAHYSRLRKRRDVLEKIIAAAEVAA